MALPLNVFRTITHVSGINTVGIYTAPIGYSSVVLLAQATNTNEEFNLVSFDHVRPPRRGGPVGVTTTELLEEFPVPGNDAANLLAGRLILETGDSLAAQSDDPTGGVKIVLSVLESLN